MKNSKELKHLSAVVFVLCCRAGAAEPMTTATATCELATMRHNKNLMPLLCASGVCRSIERGAMHVAKVAAIYNMYMHTYI